MLQIIAELRKQSIYINVTSSSNHKFSNYILNYQLLKGKNITFISHSSDSPDFAFSGFFLFSFNTCKLRAYQLSNPREGYEAHKFHVVAIQIYVWKLFDGSLYFLLWKIVYSNEKVIDAIDGYFEINKIFTWISHFVLFYRNLSTRLHI